MSNTKETPIEIANRVLPGMWIQINVPRFDWIQLLILPRWYEIDASNMHGFWTVKTTAGSDEFTETGEDLEPMIEDASDKIRSAIARLAKSVGLEVSGG